MTKIFDLIVFENSIFMKKSILIALFIFLIGGTATSQNVQLSDYVSESAISLGFGMGGGSVAGVDLELMPIPRLGLQMGGGINSFSGGINYHFYPTVHSSYFSLQVWQQGLGKNYKATFIGPMFEYRFVRYLEAGIGAGYMLDKSESYTVDSKFALAVNVGFYLPL